MLQPPKLEYYAVCEGTDSELGSPGSGSLMALSSNDGCSSVFELQGLVQAGDYLYPRDDRPPTAQSLSEASSSSSQAEEKVERRNRSPKKPIPDELKDVKYCERRKRNNMAAKKSRDARKQRVITKVQRQDFLERENAQLREEVKELRRDVNALRQLLSVRRDPAEMPMGGAAAGATPLPPLASVAALIPVKSELN